MEFINDDELVEVTPAAIRLRKMTVGRVCRLPCSAAFKKSRWVFNRLKAGD